MISSRLVARRWWVVAAALTCAPLSASALVIDTFDGPAGGQALSLVDAAYQDEVTDVASATGAVGDTRSISLLQLSPGLIGSATLQVNAASAPGRMIFSSSGVSVRSFIRYGATGTDLGLDLSPFAEFVIEGVSVDTFTSVGLSIDVCCYTSSGYAQNLPAGFSGDVVFDLSYWSGVGLENVANLEFDFWTEAGGAFQANALVARVIPEPSTAILVGCGLAGLFRSRVRRSA